MSLARERNGESHGRKMRVRKRDKERQNKIDGIERGAEVYHVSKIFIIS